MNKVILSKLFLLLGILLLSINSAVAGTVVTYVHTDHLGNPVAETNSLGRVIWRQSYTPYGEDYQQADPDGPGFTGHRNDADTDLVYMQARYYDPEIGRFLSVDPVTFSPDKPQQFNRYWYANGNPYVYKDPDGRYPESAEEWGNFAIGTAKTVGGPYGSWRYSNGWGRCGRRARRFQTRGRSDDYGRLCATCKL